MPVVANIRFISTQTRNDALLTSNATTQDGYSRNELSGNAKQTLIREATVGLGIHAHLHVHPNDLGL